MNCKYTRLLDAIRLARRLPPADVWAGVSPLGPVASPDQTSLLWDCARHQTVVILRRTNNAAEVDRIRAAVDRPGHYYATTESRFIPCRPRPPVVVDLPACNSLTELSYDELWAVIRDQAEAQGVELPLPVVDPDD